MASSAHILVADCMTAIGLEFTSSTFARVPVNEHGFLVHTNHMLLPHTGIEEPPWLQDSPARVETMDRNIRNSEYLDWDGFKHLFEDETDYPCSINRAAEGASEIATLFRIAMGLKRKKAEVMMGRPGGSSEQFILSL